MTLQQGAEAQIENRVYIIKQGGLQANEARVAQEFALFSTGSAQGPRNQVRRSQHYPSLL
jgi:hypothetical protein